MTLSFPKSSRLLSKKQYDYVFQSAQKIGVRFSTVLYRENKKDFARIGLIVSKKSAKHAHERNRFKRVVRESFRSVQHQLPCVDIVILARQKISVVDNQTLFSELAYVWKKILRS